MTNADGLASNTEPVLLILEIKRQSIESCNYASALESLMVMADSRENTLLYRESLALLITGYDADPRELPEIPEVREFFARLTNEWPHWLWFLSREQGTISLFMSLLCKIKVHRGHGQVGIEFTDKTDLNRHFGDLFDRSFPLFEAFDISPADAEASAHSAVNAIIGQ
ncbi:chlororespiratory reduction 6 domain-containing protein [Polaromonas aquatica]|uniref:Chlororespiratory reduction 6 domain-containing protein n=1 Tax=Polaromonas aquatica TaxID=332657 RepID=A0ABW1TWN6_9BURK